MSSGVASPPTSSVASSSGSEVAADQVERLLSETNAGASASNAPTAVQRLLLPVFLFSTLASSTSASVAAERVPTQAVFAGHTTGAGTLIARSRRSHLHQARDQSWNDVRPTAELVRSLWERSGLTWDQLSRLFGVSRRAVHAWATGARLNAYHQELLTELTQLVAGIDTGDPQRNRDRLLAPRSGGPSLFDEVRAQRAGRSSDITGMLPPAQLLGALHDHGPGDEVS
jgi:DNA-binding transcriptional regulator YiaG